KNKLESILNKNNEDLSMDDEIYKNKIGKSYFCKIFLFTFVTFKNIKLKILKLLIPLFCLE
ncbi:MAG TPA: hypothetical protein IAD13_02020, partial [Bacteroidetes bacterium]|nr:hypothetical protein [Candidatus Limimorpha avicola]